MGILERKVRETPYNDGNRKVIIFTAFADTADYLYSSLSEHMKDLEYIQLVSQARELLLITGMLTVISIQYYVHSHQYRR